MRTGIWNTLEALGEMSPPAAVLAEWQHLIGGEFPLIRDFLQPTQKVAQSYPCLGEWECGCRHEVVQFTDDRWLARCTCNQGGCAAPRLTAHDLIIYELDAMRFGIAVAETLGFHPPENRTQLHSAPKIWPVGIHGTTRAPVYLALAPSETLMLSNLVGLTGARPEPFILLAPTGRYRTELVTALLGRFLAPLFPLAACVAMDGSGRFRATAPIQPILDRFTAKLAGQSGIAPVLENIRREIALVREDQRELRTAPAKVVAPLYSLRKGLGTWELVFAGRKGLIEDERGAQIVAYLLRNPPREPVHAVRLETLVWAREWVESSLPGRELSPADETDEVEHLESAMDEQASGARLERGENTLLKRKFRELLEIMEDMTLPQDERDAAQLELDEMHQALDGAAGRVVVDGAAKAAERVRKSIKRLHAKLVNAVDEKQQPNAVLRDFARHLHVHLIIPSSRFNHGKGSRNRAGVAGTFTYEPPPGVVWED